MYSIVPRTQVCAFTGHRPNKLPWRDNESSLECCALQERLYDAVEALYRTNITHFISGMALGADLLFCETVIKLREQHPDVTLEAAIPCESQAEKWTEQQRSRYYRLASQCDYETLLQREYTADCMKKRNHYMVDHAGVLLAVFNGTTMGGTMQTVRYAMKQNLEVILVQP